MSQTLSVLVSGRSGQVASALFEATLPEGIAMTVLGRPDLDITDPDAIACVFDREKPNLVINAAAYTAVDQAEDDQQNAVRLNATAAENLAAEAAQHDAPIFHISTDYVFDGTKSEPYTEADSVAPLGVYGRSKLLGEQLVAAANPKHLILRTAWVYSPFGNNFLKTMLRVAGTRDELGVVSDQIGNPTSAIDIAQCLIELARGYRTEPARIEPGIYHMSATGEASWADFAEHIFAVSAELGGPTAQVNRITSEEWPTPVTRPANSRLNCDKLKSKFGVKLPDWRASTRSCIEQLNNMGELAS